MIEEFMETEQFRADFAAAGAMEFDEIDEDDLSFEVEQLSVRVQAARAWS